MGKGEIAYYDITYNFTEKLKDYVKEHGGSSCENDIIISKKFKSELLNTTKSFLQQYCSIASFQHEIGTKNGNHHYQLRLKLKSPKTNNTKITIGMGKFIQESQLIGSHFTQTSETCIKNKD